MKLDEGLVDEKLSLDMTPLLDVVFILVLFFAVTTSFISPRELDDLKGNVLSLSEDKRELGEEVERVSAALDERAAELGALAGQHRELREQHARTLEEKREQVSVLEAEIAAARAGEEKLRWMIAALEGDKAGIEKTLASVNERNAGLREQLEQAFRDYEGVKLELSGLRDAHRAQAGELASARRSAADAGARNAAFAERVAALDRTVQAKSARERLLQALIDEKAAEVAAATKDLDEARNRNDSLAGRVDTLRSDLQRQVDEEALLRTLLAEKAEEASGLATRLAAAVSEGGALSSALSAEREARAAEARRARELDARVSAQAAAAEGLERELGATRSERAALEAELESLRALAARELEASSALRARLAAMESELDKFRSLADLDREQIERIAQAHEQLRAGLGEYLADNRIDIRRDRDRLTLQLSDRILFPSGSAAIRPAGLEVLRRLGELLRERLDVIDIQVGGHTDNVPVSSARGGLLGDNWGLSAARAVSVVNFLEREVGLDAERLAAVGYGEHRPVASNDDAEGRARNRRIEIVLVPR